MQNHPLNPMTDSNLVNVLQVQSDCRVSWMNPGGESADASAPFQIADAVTDEDLEAIAAFAKSHLLLTGGSAIARYWVGAAGIRQAGAWPFPGDGARGDVASIVILAGSCSDATRQQIDEFARKHPVLRLNVVAKHDAAVLATEVLTWCEEQWADRLQPLLICSGSSSEAVAEAQRVWGEVEAAKHIESVFGEIAIALRHRGIRHLIVAGGETSGAVINALQVKAIQIGDEIAPGVPWVRTIGEPRLSLALKSGNFGGPRFFADALETAI